MVSKHSCCIKGCSAKSSIINGQLVELYTFPSENIPHRRERRQNWIDTVIKHCKFDADWTPKKNHRICSLHFVGGCKSEHPYHPGYNPTIFSGKLTEKNEIKAKARLKRFERYIKRNPVTIPLRYRNCKKPRKLNSVYVKKIKLETDEQCPVNMYYEPAEVIVPDLPEYCNFSCQVDLINNVEKLEGVTFMLSNRFIRDSNCDAETQILNLQ